MVYQPWQWRRLWLRNGARGTFSVGRLANFLPLVFVLEHGRPQRGGRGSRQGVSRAMAGGASGPEAFILLLRLLITHFDGVDTDEGYTKLHTFGMCDSMPFSDFSREFRVLVPTATKNERVLSLGTDVVLEGFRWRQMTNLRRSCLRCTLVRRQRTRGHTPHWMLCGGRLVTKRITCRQRRKFFFLSLFPRRGRGHPPRRGPGPPIMSAARPSAVPVALVADEIEPSFNCHAH